MASRDVVEFSNAALSVLGGLIEFPGESGCLILENHPTAKVVLLNEIGAAGPYPGPGVRSKAKDEFQRRLKETGSSIAAEYFGVPDVTVAAPTFVNQVYSTAATHGVPPPRAVANPGSAFPDRYTVELHARKLIEKEGGELTDPPPWMARRPRQEKIPTIPVMKPGMTALLVTGDAHRNKVQTMRGGNSATIEIQPTSNWDELMAALGYLPLEEFFLSERTR